MTWTHGPRPLRFVRIRVHQDSAPILRDLLARAQQDLYARLAELRQAGREEGDAEIQELRKTLAALIRIIADLDEGMVELVGPPQPS